MTLAGTRPPTVDEWDKYELHHRARLATKPGLTGMWQVSGRSNITDFEEVVKLDKQYISEIAIITSRGCAFDCAFCGGAKSLNKDITTRIRTEESVITEIREILSAYPDIQSIRVLDDLFLRNGKSIDIYVYRRKRIDEYINEVERS